MVTHDMRRRIEDELVRLERERNVRVLFACESGSRAWGFPSPDSDYDVRFVYAHPKQWYLGLENRRDVIEKPISDALDISGWELGKALRLLRKSNPGILEWLGSPIVYREAEEFSAVRRLVDESFDHRSSVLHYLNMAKNNKRQWLDRNHIRIKKYLYTLRPLLCAQWVVRFGSQPPMLYEELLKELHPGSAIEAAIQELVRRKLDLNEGDMVERDPFLTRWIEEVMVSLEEALLGRRNTLPPWEPYDAVFLELIGETPVV